MPSQQKESKEKVKETEKQLADQVKFRKQVDKKLKEFSKMSSDELGQYISDRTEKGLDEIEMTAFLEMQQILQKQAWQESQDKLKKIFEANQTKRIKSQRIFDKIRLSTQK